MDADPLEVDIMSTKRAARRVRTTYAFIKADRTQHRVQEMCRVLGVAPSGSSDWLKQPLSKRAQEDARLLTLIRASFAASHRIDGAPRVFLAPERPARRAARIASFA